MSKYDYCSSLFIYFSDLGKHERLDKNSAKAIKAYLKINNFNLIIDEQLLILKNNTVFLSFLTRERDRTVTVP